MLAFRSGSRMGWRNSRSRDRRPAKLRSSNGGSSNLITSSASSFLIFERGLRSLYDRSAAASAFFPSCFRAVAAVPFPASSSSSSSGASSAADSTLPSVTVVRGTSGTFSSTRSSSSNTHNCFTADGDRCKGGVVTLQRTGTFPRVVGERFVCPPCTCSLPCFSAKCARRCFSTKEKRETRQQQQQHAVHQKQRVWPVLSRLQNIVPAVTLLLLLLLAVLPQQPVAAFQATVEVPGGGKQCIGEQLSKHVLVVGEVNLLHPPPSTAGAPGSGHKAVTPLLVVALDSTSQVPIYKQQGKEHVRTAFTTTSAGTHSFCVQNLAAERMVLKIQMLWGPEARDYGQIAKAEHLDEIMLQLMRLQDRLKLYHANVLYMRQKEQKMREDSDTTASWLMVFCIVNVLLLILTALASAYYFKRFFRSKKII